MPQDREVAGIRCTQVLEQLSDYLDGELAPGQQSQIEAHLAGCSWCEQFGGEFSAIVRQLRVQLRDPPAPTAESTSTILKLLNLEL